MRAIAPILHRDHRVAHDRRNLLIVEPFAEAWPHRMDDTSVGGADPNHLAEIVAPDQLLVARQLADRDRYGDAERDQPDDQQIGADLEDGEEGALDAGGRSAGHLVLSDKGRESRPQEEARPALTAAYLPEPDFAASKSSAAELMQ